MFFTVLICLLAISGQVSTELVLEKDITETVTFDGNELEIEIDNSGGIIGDFTLCVKSSDQVPYPHCPTGYAQIRFSFGQNPDVKTAKINRQGKVMLGPLVFDTITSILFNEDESLDVILNEVPDRSTKVTLLNAIRYVPPEPTETTTPKKSRGMAMFSVVVIVLLVISGLLSYPFLVYQTTYYRFLIAGLIATVCYCRKRTSQGMKPSDDQDQRH